MALHAALIKLRPFSNLGSFSSASKRFFLSAQYNCADSWRQRLKQPIIQKMNLNSYLYELNRKYFQGGKVSAIDVDLFVNRLDKDDMNVYWEDMLDILLKFRLGPDARNVLPSTSHAVIRAFMDVGKAEMVIKIILNPMIYGIFVDNYLANILMDTFLVNEDFTAAARIASSLMLQEEFGPPLTRTLAFASAYLYAISDGNKPWVDYHPKKEEPEEDVKVRVDFLRNPYFDDHFDLFEGNHLVGKTLAWIAPHFQGPARLHCEILGWALYEKWPELSNALKQAIASQDLVDKVVIDRVSSQLEKCSDASTCESLRQFLSQITVTETFVEILQDMLKNAAEKYQMDEIVAQSQLYRSWEELREQEVMKQVAEFEKRKLVQEIKAKKESLLERERVIYFFDNKDKLELLVAEKEAAEAEKIASTKVTQSVSKSKQTVDESYVPPEVHKRFGSNH